MSNDLTTPVAHNFGEDVPTLAPDPVLGTATSNSDGKATTHGGSGGRIKAYVELM